MPLTRLSETPPLIRLGPPSSVRVKAPGLRLLVLIGSLNVTSIDETAVFRGLGETAAIEVTRQRADDLGRRLGRARRCLDVAGVVGGHAVEAVGVADLAGEGGRGRGRVGLRRRERAAVVGVVDVVAGDARAAGVVLARPGDGEAGRGHGCRERATLLVGGPASMVLKIDPVVRELWSDRPALKMTVAWALMTVPVVSEPLGWMVAGPSLHPRGESHSAVGSLPAGCRPEDPTWWDRSR